LTILTMDSIIEESTTNNNNQQTGERTMNIVAALKNRKNWKIETYWRMVY